MTYYVLGIYRAPLRSRLCNWFPSLQFQLHLRHERPQSRTWLESPPIPSRHAAPAPELRSDLLARRLPPTNALLRPFLRRLLPLGRRPPTPGELGGSFRRPLGIEDEAAADQRRRRQGIDASAAAVAFQRLRRPQCTDASCWSQRRRWLPAFHFP